MCVHFGIGFSATVPWSEQLKRSADRSGISGFGVLKVKRIFTEFW